MNQKSIVVICLLFLAGVSNIFAQNEKSDEVIKVETTLVSVPVIVSDRQDRYVPNLTAKDFMIYQDGVEQKIDFFAATDEPLNIALLIDTSRSTTEVLDKIKDSALDFIQKFRPEDKAMIVSFDYAPHVLSPLTADREQLKRAIKNAKIGEFFGTTLHDAVFETVNKSLAQIKGRKAIVLLTDGKDAGSRVYDTDLFYSLEESDTLVYTIFYETGLMQRQNRPNFPGRRRGDIFGGRFPRDNERRFPRNDGGRRRERVERQNEVAEEFLKKLSDKTAGRFYASDAANLKKTFKMIIEELRFQYRLGFYPTAETADKVLHQLKVKVSVSGAVVRARSSYRIQSKSSN
ncbi:hypothetical protein BH10ACI1_BH10ACI1_00870 [soil metagenome]